MTRPKLRWVPLAGMERCLQAYSHKLCIGTVLEKMDVVHWSMDGVKTKWIVKGYGDATSVDAGKRALARAWSIWCKRAGL